MLSILVRFTIAALLLAIAAPAVAPAQAPGVQIAVTTEDGTVFDRGREKTVDYAVTVSSPTAARFLVGLEPPAVFSRAAGAGRNEGGVLEGRGPPAVEASEGSTAWSYSALRAIPGCSPRGLAPHGGEDVRSEFIVSLAAGGQATIRVRYVVPARPLWPGVDYRLRAFAEPAPDGFGLDGQVAARGPQLRGRGAHGTLVTLSTSPRTSPFAASRNMPVVRAGRRVTLRGATFPPLRRKLVTIRAAGPRDRALRTVGRVRTTARGTFRFARLRPRRPGSWELTAFTPAVGRRVVADYACPVGFEVR